MNMIEDPLIKVELGGGVSMYENVLECDICMSLSFPLQESFQGTPDKNVALEDSVRHIVNVIRKIKTHLATAQANRKIDEIKRRLVQFELTIEDLESITLVNVSKDIEDLRDECLVDARNE